MINLKKIVAVALAATMCMSVSMTALAFDGTANVTSPGDWDGINPNSTDGSGMGSDNFGYYDTHKQGDPEDRVDVVWEEVNTKVTKDLNTQKKVAQVFKSEGYQVKEGTTFVPIAAGSMKVPGNEAVTVVYHMNDLNTTDYSNYQVGETLYGVLETGAGSGVYEVYAGTIKKDDATGELAVSFDVPHGGALVIFKTMLNKEIVALAKNPVSGNYEPIDPGQVPGGVDLPGNSEKPANGQNTATTNGTSTTGSAATSPKTGEF